MLRIHVNHFSFYGTIIDGGQCSDGNSFGKYCMKIYKKNHLELSTAIFNFNVCLCFQHGQSLSHATQLAVWLDFMPSHSPTLQCAFWPIPLPMSCTGGTRRWGLLHVQSCTNSTHGLYCLHIGLLIVLTVVLILQALSHCERITDNGIRHLTSGACSETLQVLELDNCPLITDNALELLR